MTGYRIYHGKDGTIFEEIGWVPEGMGRFAWVVGGEAAVYRFKVAAEEQDNLGEEIIAPGSLEDELRTVVVGGTVGRDEEGNPVIGLFGEDLTVGFADFFLFADQFGRRPEEPQFDPKFDLDGDALVSFGEFLSSRKILAK